MRHHRRVPVVWPVHRLRLRIRISRRPRRHAAGALRRQRRRGGDFLCRRRCARGGRAVPFGNHRGHWQIGGRHNGVASNRRDAAPRPGEVVGAAGGRGYCLAPHQHLRHHRVGHWLAVIAAQKIVGFASPLCEQRYSRPGKRSSTRARPTRGSGRLDFRFFRDRDRHRSGPPIQPPLHFALDIMGELSGAGLGEVHAVAGAQPANLALNVGAGLGIAAVLVDEAVPNIDIDDARLIGPASVEVVEKRDVGGRFLSAQRRQPHPEHRYAGTSSAP